MDESRDPRTSEEPGTLRVMYLLARLAARRWVNRMGGHFAVIFRRGESASQRQGTARKGHFSHVLMLFVAVLFLFNSLNLATQFLRRLSGAAEARHAQIQDRIPVADYTYMELQRAEETLAGLDPTLIKTIRTAYEQKALRKILRQEAQLQLLSEGLVKSDESEVDVRVSRFAQVFREKGVEGFTVSRSRNMIPVPSEDDWPLTDDERVVLSALGLLTLFLCLSLFFMSLGSGNQDLGRVEWHLEWLFSFPLPARVLFLAKVFEYALLNPFNWFVVLPLFTTLYVASGVGGWSIPLAIVTTLYLGLLLGSLRIASETWLRKNISVSQLKNSQALFTVISLLTFFLVMGLAVAPQLPKHLIRWSEGLPPAVLWNPVSLPVLLCDNPSNAWVWMVLSGWGIGLPLGASLFSSFCVRDGLLSAANPYQGTRGLAPAVHATGLLAGLKGLSGKDLRLLVRDRNLLVQTMVVPVLIIGFNVVINPTMLKSALANFQHAAMLAFSLGAYVLLFGGFSVLTAEGSALWLLFTFPQSLDSMLRRKATLWCLFGLVYAGAVLAVALVLNPFWEAGFLVMAGTALVGVILFAYIAVALGALGTDPFEMEAARKIRPSLTYLYMFLAALFAYVIYAPAIWGKLVGTVLLGLLAVALWQKVRDRLPHLLDPTGAPPPQVSIADGLAAVLAFFVLQGLLMLGLMPTPLPMGAKVFLAFAGAGAMVAFFMLYRLWRRKVPDLLRVLGLRRPLDRPGTGWLVASGVGVASGLVAGLGALLYVLALQHYPGLRAWRDELTKGGGVLDLDLQWLVWMVVVAAPLCEEFIFRALVFRGLRRSFGAWRAVLASALIFALVHPPISIVPVLGLGFMAALAFEYTGLLVAPILAHMVYNLIVVVASG
jgi:ABC-2 type transport system permease protein